MKVLIRANVWVEGSKAEVEEAVHCLDELGYEKYVKQIMYHVFEKQGGENDYQTGLDYPEVIWSRLHSPSVVVTL